MPLYSPSSSRRPPALRLHHGGALPGVGLVLHAECDVVDLVAEACGDALDAVPNGFLEFVFGHFEHARFRPFL